MRSEDSRCAPVVVVRYFLHCLNERSPICCLPKFLGVKSNNIFVEALKYSPQLLIRHFGEYSYDEGVTVESFLFVRAQSFKPQPTPIGRFVFAYFEASLDELQTSSNP